MIKPTVEPSDRYRFAKLPTAEILLSIAKQPCVQPLTIASQNRIKPVVVIDTNVWLDLLYWRDKDACDLKQRIQRREFVICITLACLEELADVISRTHFALDKTQQLAFLDEVLKLTTVVSTPESSAVRCRDEDDQKFLDLAQAVGADYLLSKDKLVLRAGKRLKKFGTLSLTPKSLSQRPSIPIG